jgi:uncharacterized protein (DUF488 family)
MDVFVTHCGVISAGYEGKDIGAFVGELAACGTSVLADIRLNAVSRKSGFSKRALAAALGDFGINYWHIPELGNPPWNRAGFHGSPQEVRMARVRFGNMLDGAIADAKIQELADAALGGVVAVMCVEADERACHRYVVLNELRRRACPHAAMA